jgi:hypothetical protein
MWLATHRRHSASIAAALAHDERQYGCEDDDAGDDADRAGAEREAAGEGEHGAADSMIIAAMPMPFSEALMRRARR